MVSIRLLGELSVEVQDRPLPAPAGRSGPQLLGWLALHPGMQPRAEVAARLWPDVLDSSARVSLRTTLSTLRKELGDAVGCVRATRDAVGLEGDVWVDVREFEACARAGRREEALELCRGELLAGLGEDWVLEARDAHRGRMRELLGALGDDAEAAGEIDAAVRWTRRSVELDPLDERAQRELIRRLADAGDDAAALAAYEKLRDRLRRELSLAPGAATRDLVAAIRAASVERGTDAVQLPLAPRLSAGALGPFVGRSAELAKLRSSWAGALAGRRRVCVVEGEPGIGKTRLARELGCVLHQEGANVLYGRCEEDALTGYQPFVEALEHYVRALPEEDAHELASDAPALARLLPSFGPLASAAPATEDAAGARYRLFTTVAGLLAATAARRPLLLVLDDLHWADGATLRLLRHLMRADEPARMLVLVTCRDSELGPGRPLRSLLADLRRDPGYDRLMLGPLDTRAVAELLPARESRELAAAVRDRTNGNPFFIEQLVGEFGALDSVEAVARTPVPAGVREVIDRRVAALGDESRRVLAVAAVAGPHFGLREVAAAAGMLPDRALDALEPAVHARLVAEAAGEPGGFAFVHALVRATLEHEMTAVRRAQLHVRLGEALERAPAATGAALAQHFLAAGPAEHERALRYGRRAAAEALEALAHEEAAALYERLVPLASDPGERSDLLVELGDARRRVGASAEADRAFEQAAAIARKEGDAPRLAYAALGRAGIGVTIVTVDHSLIALLEEALAALGEGDPALRARLLARLAIELSYAGEDGRRAATSDEAVKVARASGDDAALASALGARHVSLWGPEHLDERRAVAAEMLELAQRAGDFDAQALARNWYVCDLVEAADPAAAAQIDEFARLAQELRMPAHLWYVPLWGAMLTLSAGDVPAGARLADEAYALGTKAGDQNALLFRLIQRAFAELVAGEVTTGTIAAIEQRRDSSPARLGWIAMLAHLYAVSERTDNAHRELEIFDREGGLDGLPRDANWLTEIADLAGAAAILGDRERAGRLVPLLEPFADRAFTCARCAMVQSCGAYWLGRALATAGYPRQAASRYEQALTHHTRTGARGWAVHTHLHYGALLATHAPAKGRAELAHAHDLAQELGLARMAADAQRVSATLE
ncbi:MAG: ATP-binding protein [Solirubrobacteraceae bacterium]